MPSLPELKLRYYELMVRYYSHLNNYLEMTRCYRAMYETESVASNPDLWRPVCGQGRVGAGAANQEVEGGGVEG